MNDRHCTTYPPPYDPLDVDQDRPTQAEIAAGPRRDLLPGERAFIDGLISEQAAVDLAFARYGTAAHLLYPRSESGEVARAA